MADAVVPRLLVRTDRYRAAVVGRSLAMVAQAIATAARHAAPPGSVGVLFAEADLPDHPRSRLLGHVREAIHRGAPSGGVPLFVLAPTAGVDPTGADGAVLLPGDTASGGSLLHLRLWSGAAGARLAVPEDGIAGCVVGPVQPPLSGADDAGARSIIQAEALARVVARWAPQPVLASGGVGVANLATVLGSGVAGVVVCSAVVASVDPAAAVAQLLDGLFAEDGVPARAQDERDR